MPASTANAPGRIAAAHLADRGRQNHAHTGIRAFAHQHVDNLLRRPIAEKLSQCFFVIRDAVPLHEPDKIRRRVTRKCRFCEVRIRRKKIVGPRVQVGKVCAAASRDEDFFARAIRTLQHRNAAPTAGGFDCGHEACRACSEDEDIETVLIHGANFNDYASSRIDVPRLLFSHPFRKKREMDDTDAIGIAIVQLL